MARHHGVRAIMPLLAWAAPMGACAQASARGDVPEPEPARRPNIVMIVADDLGYNDLASYGSHSVRTPNIDRLGAEGVRFTAAYCSSPISGPSRAGILTGRCQNRFGCEFMPYDNFDRTFIKRYKQLYLKYYLPPLVRRKPEGLKDFHPNVFTRRSRYQTDMPNSELTIAELLRSGGYATALLGKWNVGTDDFTSPAEHGYDYSYYFAGALTRYVDDPVDTTKYVGVHLPWAFSELPAWQPREGATAIRENGVEVRDTGYLTFSLAEKAAKFINDNREKPFFLTLTFNAPHDPFQAPREYWDRIEERDPVKKIYYAMIEALDDAVGKVIATLERDGLYDNTLIIFASDNGGAAYTRATDNAPLNGGKCTMFQGGLLVPMLIKFSGSDAPAGEVYTKPVSLLDLMPTVAAAADIELPADRQYDGCDLKPYAAGDSLAAPHGAMFWRNGYVKACISDGWKLYTSKKSPRVLLYNLAQDPDETTDMSNSNPEKVTQLRKMISDWERTQTIRPLWPSSGNLIQKVRGRKFRFPV